jgi:hypothetical protein
MLQFFGAHMRHRITFCVALFAIGGLTACGGGGGSVGTPPSPNSSPAAPQDLTFSGSKEIQATYAYPAASPYPPEDLKSTLSQSTVAYSNINGVAGIFYTTQTETLPTVTHTTTVSATTATQTGTSGATDLILGSVQIKDDSGDSQSLSYPSPITIDEQPETAGAMWSDTAALTSDESFADGSTDTRTQNADGSYVDKLVSPDGTNATLQVFSTGEGKFSTPNNAPGIAGGCIASYDFGAATGATFPIQIVFNNEPICGGAPPGSVPVPGYPNLALFTETAATWFTVSSSTPLYSDKTKISAITSYPANCAVPASAGKPANQVERTVDSVDPLLGYVEATVTDTYTANGGGAVCVEMGDDVLAFYDWQGTNTNGSHNFLSGSPIQETLTSQVLTLQNSSSAPIGAQSAARLAPASIASAEANFGSRVGLDRTRKTQSILKTLRTRNPFTNIVQKAHVTPFTFAGMHARIEGGRSK